jgi:hypothetical protein
MEAAIHAAIHEYYNPVPYRRLLAPRTAAQVATRGTCVSGFPTDEIVNQVLYRPEMVARDYMYFRRIIVVKSGDLWLVSDTFEPHEYALLKYAIYSGIPVLGTIHIKLTDAVGHEVAFLLRSITSIEVLLFETYDTTALTPALGGTRQWADEISLFFLGIYNEEANSQLIDMDRPRPLTTSSTVSVVPPGFNLQAGEGTCVQWSLIFLSFLRDAPGQLRTASPEYFRDLYYYIYSELQKPAGAAHLMARVYGTAGAGRRKTRKNRGTVSHIVRRRSSKKGVRRRRV